MTEWLYPSPWGNGLRRHIPDPVAPEEGVHRRSLCGRNLLVPSAAATAWITLERADAMCREVCVRCTTKAARQ